MAGSHRVPIPSQIVPHELVHVAIDNFDHKKHVSGIDTILILFQNIKDTELCNGQLETLKKRFK